MYFPSRYSYSGFSILYNTIVWQQVALEWQVTECNIGNIIGENFLVRQKSVGHWVWRLTHDAQRPFLCKCKVHEGEWETLHKTKGPLLSLLCSISLSRAHDHGSAIWPPRIEPSDLSNLDPLQSCSLWYLLHRAKYSARFHWGVFPYTSGTICTLQYLILFYV